MYRLTKVESAEHWRDLHAIRRETLFETGVFPFVYDENRPEDRRSGNTPYLLLLDGKPIGVVRLDVHDSIGVVRLVGISAAWQRQGHGRALSDLIDEEAAAHGISELRVNAYKDAIGFYEKTGWVRQNWDADELSRLAPGNVQMIKTARQD
ncbi:hypothetical protein ASF24_09655 [Methylobacterium sp. Leaf86]|uniref:GNAT family N-acetyltransferase n=1 Tax=Methylobacterium sp. Leaf86 TaxID=1736242 RepID=UPI0006FAF187|nr:GNAT family N-acetyltransferase [Methylobacterium sp. Leaf86]KQO49397.1 hypothetical protein ASF24_09655 [Methylobacterium sp. Leaf86]